MAIPIPLRIILVLFISYKVSLLTLTVQSNYIQVGDSGVTLECNLDGAPWDITTSPRRWNVPPNTQTAINDGIAISGYTEDLSDAATSGIIRMTTPPLDWNIENEIFQCLYKFDTASLNATRSILARNSGGSATYDETAKKCVFSVSEILPSPSTVITLAKNLVQSDISADFSRVRQTLTNNNDQGQTYNYRIKVEEKDFSDGDQVIFQMTAGPYSVNKTCEISTEPSRLSAGEITGIVVGVLLFILILMVFSVLAYKRMLPCQTSENKNTKVTQHEQSERDHQNTRQARVPNTQSLHYSGVSGYKPRIPMEVREEPKKTPRRKKKKKKKKNRKILPMSNT